MTKQQFINELSAALTTIDPQTCGEIMADINEHFIEGASHGLSEEEICKNLGQPGQIAEQVLEEYRAYKNQYGGGQGDSGQSGGRQSGSAQNFHSSQESRGPQAEHDPWDSTNDAINNISNMVGEIVGNVGNMVGDIAGNVGNMVGDIVGNMDNTTRTRGGYSIDIDESFSGVSSLDISLNVCTINIVPAPQLEGVRVVIQGQSRYNNFIIENRNGCLVITEKYPVIRFEIFRFKTNLIATIFVPASFYGDVKARASAGSISTSNIRGNIDFKASAGDIRIDSHQGHTAFVRSSAGSVYFRNCDIRNIDAKSSAGDVIVEGQDMDSLSLDSSAGNVKVHVARLGGETRLSSSAGTVHLDAKDVNGNITAKSSAGSVYMRLPREVNCRIEAKKPSMGSLRNNLVGNPQSPYVLQVSSSVGSVVLEAID